MCILSFFLERRLALEVLALFNIKTEMHKQIPGSLFLLPTTNRRWVQVLK